MHPTGQVYIARHVIFDEHSFPYSSDSVFTLNNSCQHLSFTPQQVYHLSILSIPSNSNDSNTYNLVSVSSNSSSSHHSVNYTHNNNSQPLPQIFEPHTKPHNSLSTQPFTTNTLFPSQILPNIVQYTSTPENTQHITTPANTHSMTSRSKARIFKPKVYNASLVHKEPDSVKEAMQDSKWLAAMKEEYNALLKNNT